MRTTSVRHRSAVVLAALGLAVGAAGGAAACGDDDTTTATTATTATTTASAAEPVIDPGDGGTYQPQLDPADFVAVIDNPYLPFKVGSRWVYESSGEDEVERIEVTVLPDRKEILGIQATVVRDTVTIDGVLVEDTLDWFAQDRAGNVWYLGESVKNYEDGELVDTEGSFEAGADGAFPGIVMLAQPSPGDAYRQEYYPGEAEDLGEVLRVGQRTTVPAGEFTDVVVTRDWNPLEPEVIEEKHYAPGVGLVYEEHVAGGPGEASLVEYAPAA